MKLHDIDALFEKSTRAKKLADEARYLADMRRQISDGLPFEISVLCADSIEAHRWVIGTQSLSPMKVVSATVTLKILEGLEAEIDARVEEIEGL